MCEKNDSKTRESAGAADPLESGHCKAVLCEKYFHEIWTYCTFVEIEFHIENTTFLSCKFNVNAEEIQIWLIKMDSCRYLLKIWASWNWLLKLFSILKSKIHTSTSSLKAAFCSSSSIETGVKKNWIFLDQLSSWSPSLKMAAITLVSKTPDSLLPDHHPQSRRLTWAWMCYCKACFQLGKESRQLTHNQKVSLLENQKSADVKQETFFHTWWISWSLKVGATIFSSFTTKMYILFKKKSMCRRVIEKDIKLHIAPGDYWLAPVFEAQLY